MKAIVWALTGVEQHFKQDIRSWIEEVLLEFSIADGIYTIRYAPRPEQPKVTGFIAMADINTVSQNESTLHILTTFVGTLEMTERIDAFFSEKLHFLQPQPSIHDENQKKISWQVYSQALFLGGDYTDYLFPKSNLAGKPHQKTLSIYLGLGSTDALTKLELVRDKARDDYKFESRRIMTNAQGVREKIGHFQNELQDVDLQLQAIDTGQSVLVDADFISRVQEQIAQYISHIVDISAEEQQLLKDERETQKKIDEKQRTCQELHEAIQFKVFLSGLAIERCPHCEQGISVERVNEEIHKKTCRLCQSELRPVESTEQYEFVLQETEERLQHLEHSLKNTKKEIRRVTTLRKKEEEEAAQWRLKLQDMPRQERAGFTQEMRDLLNKRGYIHGQLQQLNEQIEEVHSQMLEHLKETQDILEVAVTEMQALIWQYNSSNWSQLEKRTTELAKLFGVNDLEAVSFQLGNRFDLSIKQGGNFIHFRDMEASEMLRLKLAFHLAMLLVRTIDGIGRHPGLLIIDAPGGAEMDEQHFNSILQGFLDVKEQLGSQAQLLIASTKETIASLCEPRCCEQLKDGEGIF